MNSFIKVGFVVAFFSEYVYVKVDFVVTFFNEYVHEGGGLGAMFGNQRGGHQGGNNKALQYR